ncbi:MarR family transcriptional regulator [Herbiconiux sp.]|uniref:MarR family winged helix-turn-helix transcriptional regulator n=1 Tax=Herbiconiux sp. TaxID=1871186 RepID=UPI0025BF8377|nr:MarR family transcriptional regulator [Herbiconiux sp.]
MTAYGDVFTELVSTEIALWNQLDRMLTTATGVSAAQLQALTAIDRLAGSARVQDVSETLQITVGAASKLIDRLERDGLAGRSAHPRDRRSMVIQLTTAGEEALAEASVAAESSLVRLLGAHLDPDRARSLATALRSVREGLTAGVLA